MPNLISPRALSSGYLINEDYKKLNFVEINDTAKIEIEEGNVITYATQNGYIYYRLENEFREELSLIRLKKITVNNRDFYAIDKSKSFIQGKGYAVPLYEYSFCYLDLPVISDINQTKPGSSNLWKKFQQRQTISNYEIIVFNTDTDHMGNFITRNYNDYDVWGWDPDFILMIKENLDFLDEALKYKDISKKLYQFLNQNLGRVRDRRHIRLFGKIKNSS